MYMLRMVYGVFLLALMLSTASAQDFEQRYRSASGVAAINPAATEALSDFVDIMSRAGYFDLALAAIENHLEHSPHDAGANLIAARTYKLLGAHDQAETHVRLAMQSGSLDEIHLRRAALLLAKIGTSQNVEPGGPSAGAQPYDPVATAALPEPDSSRNRIRADHAEYRLDDNVLRRIYGAPSRPAEGAKIGDPLAGRQPGVTQANALVGTGGTYWSHLLGNDSGQREAEAAPGSAGAPLDMSLRYTFALY